MKEGIVYSIHFVLYILVQVLILSQIDFGWGIHPMIYPLFIIMLPFQLGIIPAMAIAFALGISIDFFMNTFGLHASAAVIVAYLRPEVLKFFAPRDGYDSFTQPSIRELGIQWFIPVASILIIFHHFWFFFLEIFKTDALFYIFKNTVLSAIASLILCYLIQILFFKNNRPL